MKDNDSDRRSWLVTAAKAGISQAKIWLNALWAVTPEKKERDKIAVALTALDEAMRQLNTLFQSKEIQVQTTAMVNETLEEMLKLGEPGYVSFDSCEDTPQGKQ